MTFDEASNILEQYGDVVAKSSIKHLNDLPCSKAKIKQAYFTYLPELYKREGKFYDEFISPLVMCYGQLNAFIAEDDANKLEIIQAKIDKRKKDEDYDLTIEEGKRYINYTKLLQDGSLINEINEFIAEIISSNK